MDWINLAQDRDRWPAVVYAGFRKIRGNCGLAEDVLASQEELCPKQFVVCIGCMCTKYFPSVRTNKIAAVKHIRSRVLCPSQLKVPSPYWS
jgi:hypothetical protein